LLGKSWSTPAPALPTILDFQVRRTSFPHKRPFSLRFDLLHQLLNSWTLKHGEQILTPIGLEVSWGKCHRKPQTTDLNPGQTHCLALKAPALELWQK
jgi:hypothetical protein